MAADLHADYLWDAGAAHISYGSAAQVMKIKIRDPCPLAGLIPSPPKIEDALAGAVEDPRRGWPFLITLLFGGRQQIAHVAVDDRHRPCFVVLGLAFAQRNQPGFEIDLRPLDR